jgi:hypothetical protein
MRGKGSCLGSLSGCLVKLVLFGILITAGIWVLTVALNPWALHIGGRSTPLLYWHGMGVLHAEDGKTYPLYVSWWPGRPRGFSSGGRREGKHKNADLSGTGWLCVAPGTIERMKVSGDMYGGYASDKDSLVDFRFLEWRKAFSINYQNRGFFDVAGTWLGPLLVMDRPGEQGIKLHSGPFIHHAAVTFHWANYSEFESACRNSRDAITQ